MKGKCVLVGAFRTMLLQKGGFFFPSLVVSVCVASLSLVLAFVELCGGHISSLRS